MNDWFTEINDSLEQINKINRKMKRLNATKDMINGYIAYMEKESKDTPKKDEKTTTLKEPSKEDFKTTCDSLLKQLKDARIKIDELTEANKNLTEDNKELNSAIASLEDTNRILLTTIDILNNKLEDLEEYLYINDLDEDYEYEEDNEEHKDSKPKQEKKKE